MYKNKSTLGKITFISSLVIVSIFLLCLVFGSVYTVQEDEYAVVKTWGRTEVIEQPGIKFKIPLVQKVTKVSKASKQFSIGYDIETEQSIEKESFMISNDFNFVNVDFYFEYYISDPIAYLYNAEDPVAIVKNLAQSYIRDTVCMKTVDEVLTTGKFDIQTTVKEKITARLIEENIGITITNAVIQDSEPPTAEVAQAFKNVEDAKQGMETAINNAKADSNTRIPQAEALADKTIKAANATKEARIAEANGQVARFNSLYEEYVKFPLITKERMLYETLEKIMPGMDVYITDGDTETLLPLEPFNSYNTLN